MPIGMFRAFYVSHINGVATALQHWWDCSRVHHETPTSKIVNSSEVSLTHRSIMILRTGSLDPRLIDLIFVCYAQKKTCTCNDTLTTYISGNLIIFIHYILKVFSSSLIHFFHFPSARCCFLFHFTTGVYMGAYHQSWLGIQWEMI